MCYFWMYNYYKWYMFGEISKLLRISAIENVWWLRNVGVIVLSAEILYLHCFFFLWSGFGIWQPFYALGKNVYNCWQRALVKLTLGGA